MKALLETGHHVFANVKGNTPVHYAAYKGNAQIVGLLVMPNVFLNEMSDHSKTLQKHFIFIQRHRVSAIADQRN